MCLESSSLCARCSVKYFEDIRDLMVTWKTESVFFTAAAAVHVHVLCGHRRVVKTVNKREVLVGGECASVHPAAGGRGIKH